MILLTAKDFAMRLSSPFRIVSLVPSLTDLCFALGLGDFVVGRTDYCISPADKMAAIPSVGGPQTVDTQKFCDLKPTHVLISPEENRKDILPLIERCHAEAILVHPLSPEDNVKMFSQFGAAFQCKEQAEKLTADLEEALKQAHNCKKATPMLHTLPLIWKDPWMTVSPQTYAAAMLDAVGMTVPHISDALYPSLKSLKLETQHLDVIALTTEPYSFTQQDCLEVSDISDAPYVGLVSGEALAWYGSYAITALKDLVAFKQKVLSA